MSSENKKCPWKNGYWLDVKEKNNVTFIDGENIESINHVYLDYPELKPETTIEAKKGTWTYGDFGPAPAEIVELAGLPNFNIQVQLSGEDNEITFCQMKMFVKVFTLQTHPKFIYLHSNV